MIQIAKIDLNHKLQLHAYEYQKQSPGGVLRKRFYLKFCKIHRKTHLTGSLFKKVNLLKKRLLHRCFPMNFAN